MTLVILVPVLFAFIGFAVDLGMIYSVRGELKQAAGSMAIAAAQQLIGTGTSTAAAEAAAELTVETSSGFGNRYYFHGVPIQPSPGSYFATAADAIASTASQGSEVDGLAARHVRITITGQSPRLFWGFMPAIGDRNFTVAATAVAGISPPLCLACGIEPFALAALNPADTIDYGFIFGTKYSLTYLCTSNGGVTPAILPGASRLVSYLMLNRYDPNATVLPDQASQAFRVGAGGLPGGADTAQACFRVNNTEIIWAGATVNLCSTARVPPAVTAAICGLDSRFESTTPAACAGIPSVDILSTIYQPDTDPNNYDNYSDYTGDGRRIVTLPIVNQVSGAAAMTVLGFRQFLLIPSQGAVNLNPADAFGRFAAMYIGSVAPLKQGRFDGCQLSAGPGKVVLHQ